MDVDSEATLGSYDAAEKSALDAYFTGERAVAEQMLRACQTYELDDRKLRQKITTDLPEAVRFDTSPAAGLRRRLAEYR
ncbi:hypothetical protein [Catenulispora rubra]|uniref:hypothetical protein n=1 Tax=Catenulispora rubra TaxID=280293 RepID=UPI00189236B6|nr:hypothetical protein [Catenulispora rubra]